MARLGLILVLAINFLACNKPEDDLGLEVMDPADALGTYSTDTTGIIAWTIRPEPGNTNGLSRAVVGSYWDPDFGMVNASSVFQMRLSSNIALNTANIGFVCDSLILSLVYEVPLFGYGTTEARSFSVQRLSADLRTDTTYQSDDVPAVFPEELVEGGRRTFSIDPNLALTVGGTTLLPQLRIPLSRELGQEILGRWGQAELSSNDLFLPWFKGLHVSPGEEASAPYQQGVLHFALLSPESRVRLYYHNTDGTTFSFDFAINSNSVRYNVARFDHARAVQPGLSALLADTTLGGDRIFVQALGGLRSRVHFASLSSYPAGTALAKAELIVPVDGTHYPLYTPPTQLFVFTRDAAGEDLGIRDYLSGAGYLGEAYDAVDNEYRFEVTRWAQAVINGDLPNTGLTFVPSNNGVSVNRAIIHGPSHTDRPMQLRLTFTTY